MKNRIDFYAEYKRQPSSHSVSVYKYIPLVFVFIVFIGSVFFVVSSMKKTISDLNNEINDLSSFVYDDENIRRTQEKDSLQNNNRQLAELKQELAEIKTDYDSQVNPQMKVFNAIINGIGENGKVSFDYDSVSDCLAVSFLLYGDNRCYDMIEYLRAQTCFYYVKYDGYSYSPESNELTFTAYISLSPLNTSESGVSADA